MKDILSEEIGLFDTITIYSADLPNSQSHEEMMHNAWHEFCRRWSQQNGVKYQGATQLTTQCARHFKIPDRIRRSAAAAHYLRQIGALKLILGAGSADNGVNESAIPGDPQGVYLLTAKQLGEAIMLKYNSSPEQSANWIRRSIEKADASDMTDMSTAYAQLYKCIQWTIVGNEYSFGSYSNDEFTVEDLGDYVQGYKDGFPELGQVVYDFLHYN